jgi:hypothetical protein
MPCTHKRPMAARLAVVIALVTSVLVATPGATAGAADGEPLFLAPWECGKTMFPASRAGHVPAIDFHGYGPEWPNYPNAVGPGDDELGAPALAIAAGTATVSYGPSAGWKVTIDHGEGWTSTYLHLIEGSAVSGAVSQGQVIGLIGDSGNAVGAHLHLGISHNGVPVEIVFDDVVVPYEWGISTRNDDPAISPRVISTNCGGSEPPSPQVVTSVHLANSHSAELQTSVSFSTLGSAVVAGDFDGDGSADLGNRSANIFELLTSSGAPLGSISYGKATDQLLVGDWDCDGDDTLAVRRGNVFYLKNTVASGNADVVLGYGRAADEVFVGDWDNDGCDTFAVRRGNEFFVRNSNTTGIADVTFGYGKAADRVYVGDFDGDGSDSFAVRRGTTNFVSNTLVAGPAEFDYEFGLLDDGIVVGDWDGDGAATFGAVRVTQIDGLS